MRYGRILAGAALAALVGTSASSGQMAPPAGLAPGEHVFALAGGCHIVTEMLDGVTEAQMVDFYKNYVWKGDCLQGMADGTGFFGDPKFIDNGIELPGATRLENSSTATFVLGRQAGPKLTIRRYRIDDGTTVKEVSADYSVPGMPFVALININNWSKPSWGYSYYGKTQVMVIDPGSKVTIARADVSTCVDSDRKAGPFRGCTIGAPTYGVEIVTPDNVTTVTACPSRTSAEGCEAVWSQVAEPVIARARPVVEAVEQREAATHARLDPLHAQVVQQAAAEQKRQAAAAAAAQAKANADFQTSLQTLGAGELFAKGDELRRAGDQDRARQAFTALITRFPSSPLAGPAGQAMLESSRPAASAAPAAAAPASNGPACAGSPDQELAAFTDELNAVKAQHPMPSGSSWGVYQWTYAFMSRGMTLLEPRRACLGEANYQSNRQALMNAAQSAKQGCEAVSSTGGACPVDFR